MRRPLRTNPERPAHTAVPPTGRQDRRGTTGRRSATPPVSRPTRERRTGTSPAPPLPLGDLGQDRRNPRHEPPIRLGTLLRRGVNLRLDDRLPRQDQVWITEFIDANELGLALEQMADALSEDDCPISPEERADMRPSVSIEPPRAQFAVVISMSQARVQPRS
ncbi:MafI family immunity protein [Kribbella sp. NPDC056951]|uniref:MafI family immunity protein n=1 Tax=Kribbella sp. NPDC056951 TaxID=3345978 RepID=UPI00362BB2DD